MSKLGYLKRCPCCKKWQGVKRAKEYGMYGSVYLYPYHDDCLEDVLCHPEKYVHKIVDNYIGITEKIKSQKAVEDAQDEYIHKQQEKARAICVDELMGDQQDDTKCRYWIFYTWYNWPMAFGRNLVSVKRHT